MADKKLSELPLTSAINAEDISLLVSDGTDYKFAFGTLLQFIGSNLNVGAKVTVGTVMPSNSTGKNGDLFIKTDTGAFAQKGSGVWTVVYTIPSSTGVTNGTILYGVGAPGSGTGSDNDTYINTGTGIFYKKTAGSWNQAFSMQTGPQGPQGTAGTNGTNGTNGFSVLNGTTTPSNISTGVNGDFYINTSTYTIYGPKTGGVWGDGMSLIGTSIPNGGTAGQALVKTSDDDFDANWGDIDVAFENITGDVNDNASLLAALGGKADLVAGKVPSAQLPSYVDDVLEFSNFAALPATGETSKIYVTLDTNFEYRWSGSAYIQIVASPGSTDAVPEGSANKYFTAARALASLLTGIGFGDATAITATDSFLSAFGKLQKQITNFFDIVYTKAISVTNNGFISINRTNNTRGIFLTADGLKIITGDGTVVDGTSNFTEVSKGLLSFRDLGTYWQEIRPNDGTLTGNGTFRLPNKTGNKILATIDDITGGGTTTPVWNRKGVAIEAELPTDENVTGEATVLYETAATIFTTTQDGKVFKCWFTVGWDNPNICYAESLDGIKWIRRSGFVVVDHYRSTVLKVGSTYYMYAAYKGAARIDRLTSTDGVTWTLTNTGVVVKNTGSWNSGTVQNSCVIYDSGTWKMILEGYNAGTGVASLGYYTSTDGIIWTEYGSNPVLSLSARSWGGPNIHKVGSTFYMWCHGTSVPNSQTPTDLYRFSSTDLINWTINAAGAPILKRLMSDEGVNNSPGQVGDADVVEANGKTYLFYAGVINGLVQSTYHLKVAVADMTMAELVTTNEGDGGILEHSTPDVYTKTQSDAKYLTKGTPNPLQVGNIGIQGYLRVARNAGGTSSRPQAQYDADQIYFYNSADGGDGVNFIGAGATGWNITSMGSVAFTKYGGGTMAVLGLDGSLALEGGISVKGIGSDYVGGAAYDVLEMGNSGNGGIVRASGRTFRRACFSNSDAATRSNTAAEGSVTPTGNGSASLHYPYPNLVGRHFVFTFSGVYSTPVGGGAITFRIKYCGTNVATCTLGGLAASASALRFDGQCNIVTKFKSPGEDVLTGEAYVDGAVTYSVGDDAAPKMTQLNNGGALITGLNNGYYNGTYDVTAQWDTADAAKVLKVTRLLVEMVG
ncbi:hypothetical protein [Mucilaginibacter sp. HD30]